MGLDGGGEHASVVETETSSARQTYSMGADGNLWALRKKNGCHRRDSNREKYRLRLEQSFHSVHARITEIKEIEENPRREEEEGESVNRMQF